jgi:hypothetical protein
LLSGLLGYSTDINGDKYPVILKFRNRFLYFYDIPKDITIDFFFFKKKKPELAEFLKKSYIHPTLV